MSRTLIALKKVHKLIIHEHKKIKDDREWYLLARREIKLVERLTVAERALLCAKCFG